MCMYHVKSLQWPFLLRNSPLKSSQIPCSPASAKKKNQGQMLKRATKTAFEISGRPLQLAQKISERKTCTKCTSQNPDRKHARSTSHHGIQILTQKLTSPPGKSKILGVPLTTGTCPPHRECGLLWEQASRKFEEHGRAENARLRYSMRSLVGKDVFLRAVDQDNFFRKILVKENMQATHTPLLLKFFIKDFQGRSGQLLSKDPSQRKCASYAYATFIQIL
eukprot:scaffold434_cov186-Pinguiococcus_pyrenoidosus.AAC.158